MLLTDIINQTVPTIKYFTEDTQNTKEGMFRKDRITKYYIAQQLRRTSQMFDWKITWHGEPSKKITKRAMELLIQSYGCCGIIEHENELYALYGTLGGEPNWEYMPTIFVCANAFLNLSHTYNIYDVGDKKKDVVIIPNDSLYQGMIPMLDFHSEILTEIELTKRAIYIWLRAPKLITAPTSQSMQDIKDYLKDLTNGNLSGLYDKNILKDVQSLDGGTSHVQGFVTQLLEAQQYEKAALFNDCGLQLNYNMKRETITSSEAQLGEGSLLPTPDDMMDMRKIAVKQIKEVFDENWEVEFNSAWKDLRKSISIGLKVEESKVEDNNKSIQMDNEDNNAGNSNLSGGHELDRTDNGNVDSNDNQSDSDGRTEETLTEIAEELDVAAEQLIEIVHSNGQGDEDEQSTDRDISDAE